MIPRVYTSAMKFSALVSTGGDWNQHDTIEESSGFVEQAYHFKRRDIHTLTCAHAYIQLDYQ